MEAGRWWTHLGFERGNAVVEAQQRVVGRPWSRMVKNGSTTIATNATPTINYIDSSHYWVSRKRRTSEQH